MDAIIVIPLLAVLIHHLQNPILRNMIKPRPIIELQHDQLQALTKLIVDGWPVIPEQDILGDRDNAHQKSLQSPLLRQLVHDHQNLLFVFLVVRNNDFLVVEDEIVDEPEQIVVDNLAEIGGAVSGEVCVLQLEAVVVWKVVLEDGEFFTLDVLELEPGLSVDQLSDGSVELSQGYQLSGGWCTCNSVGFGRGSRNQPLEGYGAEEAI